MLSSRQKHRGSCKEVGDRRQLVYDFKRRSQEFFENYRPIGYKKPPLYDLTKMKKNLEEDLSRIVAAGAADSDNADCLLDTILGPVRSAIQYLEEQRIEHIDFYKRYEIRRKTDLIDLLNLDALLREKEEVLKREHEFTQKLRQKTCGYKEE